MLILENRFGACVHLIPINSRYRWKGKIESAKEILMQIKTRPELADKLVDFIRKNHSYELPEIIVTNTKAEAGYARWVFKETR
jgi:periplasmic divalent cation tolerance protein